MGKFAPAIKLAISGGLILLLVSRIDLGEAGARLVGLRPEYLVLALAGVAVQTCLWAARFALLSGALIGAPMGFAASLRVCLIAIFWSNLTLSYVGGDASRAWLLRRQGAGLGDSLACVSLDSICGVLGLAILAFPGLLGLLVYSGDWSLFAVAIALAAAAPFLFVGMAVFGRIEARFGHLRLVQGLATIRSRAGRLFRDGRLRNRAVGLAALGHAFCVGSAVCISHAIGEPLPVLMALAVYPLVLLVSVVPISLAGWGVREGAMVVAFGLIGYDALTAVAISVLIGLLYVALGLIGGAIMALGGRARPAPAKV
jgi:hypothetical protein